MTSTHRVSAIRRPAARLAGWPIVGWSSLVLVLMVAVLLGAYGVGEIGLRGVIRATARTSIVLFLSAFAASSLRARWPSPATRWLLANRRYLGVSFAVSHFLHLLAILALLAGPADFTISAGALIGGGLAYVFIAAMVATSFDRSAAWVGPRRWRRLHTAGMYYIWFIFFISYVPRAIVSPAYMPLAALLVGALALRVSARRAVPKSV